MLSELFQNFCKIIWLWNHAQIMQLAIAIIMKIMNNVTEAIEKVIQLADMQFTNFNNLTDYSQ